MRDLNQLTRYRLIDAEPLAELLDQAYGHVPTGTLADQIHCALLRDQEGGDVSPRHLLISDLLISHRQDFFSAWEHSRSRNRLAPKISPSPPLDAGDRGRPEAGQP